MHSGRDSPELCDSCIFLLRVECVNVFKVVFLERTDRQTAWHG